MTTHGIGRSAGPVRISACAVGYERICGAARGRAARWRGAIARLALLGGLLAGVGAEAAVSLQRVGAWGGHCRTVQFAGHGALATMGGDLVSVDLSDPLEPRIVQRVPVGPLPYALEVRDGIAYVGVYGGGLQIVDASDPANMQLIGRALMGASVRGLALSGNLLFAAKIGSDLGILDVSDPSLPQVVGAYSAVSDPYCVAATGTIAFVGGSGGASPIHVIDASTLPLPSVITTFGPGSLIPYDLSLSQGLLFATQGFVGLGIYDVSHLPSRPLVSRPILSGFASSVAVDGNLAVVTTTNHSMALVSLNVPLHPVVEAEWDEPDEPFEVAIAGDRVLLADRPTGIVLYDVSNPASPAEISRVPASDFVTDVAVRNGWAYLADRGYQYGVHVVDVSDPSAPRGVARLDTPGPAERIGIAGDKAYVVCGNDGLLIFDLSTPDQPQPVGSLDSHGALDVRLEGGLAYVADGNSLDIVDVTNPSAPVLLGSATPPNTSFSAVAVQDGRAFAVGGRAGFRVYDVGDPTSPVQMASLALPANAIDVVVHGDTAYVAAVEAGLVVVDVSQPTAPQHVATLTTTDAAVRLHLTERYLFVGDEIGGIAVYDIIQPQAPALVTQVDTPGDAWGMQLVGEHLFAADIYGGFAVYEFVGALGACCRSTVCGDCPSGQCRYLPPYTCDVRSLMPDGWTGCRGDVDGNGTVNAGDRGHLSANMGTVDSATVCRYDLNGDGLVNATDRDVLSTLAGSCLDLPDFQDGSGMNGGMVDPRFGTDPVYRGTGSSCGESDCDQR